MTLNIVSILGSVRPGRMVERVAKLLHKHLEKQGVKPLTMDPLEVCSYSLVKQPLHFISKKEDIPDWMNNAHEIILKADGFFVLASEYNCGIPPALTNFMNTFPPSSYRHKPVGIVVYSMGNFAGVRILTVVRPYLNELGLIPVPCYVPIPTVHTLIDENGNTQEPLVTARMELAVKEVLWYAEGLKEMKRKKPLPPSG